MTSLYTVIDDSGSLGEHPPVAGPPVGAHLPRPGWQGTPRFPLAMPRRPVGSRPLSLCYRRQCFCRYSNSADPESSSVALLRRA